VKTENVMRVLIGKPGLDGHDVGAKVITLALRDAGMEVIYTGLHREIDEIVETALQEDVDVIGLSILSGSHLPIMRKLIEKLKQKGISDIPVVIGGVIPKRDFAALKSYGVVGIFPFGTPLSETTAAVSRIGKRKR
jgi:methylmalonyl-CoA mutase, C-terminal domain